MSESPLSRPTVTTSVRTAAIWESVSALARARQRELGRPLVVLDLGGGTGGLAVPLAVEGHHVHVLDPSPDALASLQRRAAEQGLGDDVEHRSAGTIAAQQGDADTITDRAAVRDLVGGRGIDLICCHGALEMVDDPDETIRAMAALLAPGAALSLVTAGRLAAVLSRVLAGKFVQAQRALISRDGRWGDADPLPRRFDIDTLRTLLTTSGFAVESVQGVRIFADLVPSAYIDTELERRDLLELEAAAAEHHPLLGELGAAIHFVARRRSH